MERLKQLEEELRRTMGIENQKKQELSDQLSQSLVKIEQLASSRQVYQEVDLKDSALAAATKDCEDCKEKNFRLKLNIETLKQSIPRFLTKVTKVSHPRPTESQVN
jgi:hypothetical protein